MALKHHAAPEFFRILRPPGEGAPRRPPSAARFASGPRTGATLDFKHRPRLCLAPVPGQAAKTVPASLGTWSGRV